MTKFLWENTKKYEEAEFVLFGVPDETNSERKGAALAPDAIRNASEKYEIAERNKDSLSEISPTSKKIHDYGNKRKKDVASLVEKAVKSGKIPIAVGGDHSITAEVLRGIDKTGNKTSVVYFDAHPDFIYSDKKHAKHAICDIAQYSNIDFSSSIELGVRVPEHSELAQLRKKIKTLTVLEIEELGVRRTFSEIRRAVGKNIYVSIDMDVVDPAFAPGVSTPVPGGINSAKLIHLMKMLAGVGLVGFDIMEVNPTYDRDDITTHLAARTIIETVMSHTKN